MSRKQFCRTLDQVIRNTEQNQTELIDMATKVGDYTRREYRSDLVDMGSEQMEHRERLEDIEAELCEQPLQVKR